MSQPRTAGGVAARFGRQHVLTAMKIFLTANWFRRRPVRSSQRWQLRWLVYVTLMMMWVDAGSLGERFEAARSTLAQWFIGRRRPGDSYQGSIKALVKWTEALPAELLPHLRLAMQAMAGAHWKGQGWLAIAVDGTRIDLPRSAANEAAHGDGGKASSGPKLQLTSLWHMGLNLLWDWRQDAPSVSEREHLRQMMDVLPRGSLLVADAGFTGYELLRAMIDGGRHFLIRVGSNVRLIKRLEMFMRCRGDLVWLWPADQRKNQQPPLCLRRIVVNDGRAPVYLITSVPDAHQLSAAAASRLYARRWGVEVYYRSLKQTMGQRKLHSRAARQAAVELQWAIVALWLVGLLAVKQQIDAGRCPGTWSPAQPLRAMRQALRGVTLGRRGGDLLHQLARPSRMLMHTKTPKSRATGRTKRTTRPPARPTSTPPPKPKSKPH